MKTSEVFRCFVQYELVQFTTGGKPYYLQTLCGERIGVGEVEEALRGKRCKERPRSDEEKRP